MDSSFIAANADALVGRLAREGIGSDLAIRIYTARLLGQDTRLVLHGGGNASVKGRAGDLLGETHEVLYIKGSGADMSRIGAAGLPAVRLAPLRALLQREAIVDIELAKILRVVLLDPAAPNPSVETLLHVSLPARYVEHTHPSALLSLLDQPDGAALIAEVYGERVGLVPYVRPGFGLAKAAAATFAHNPRVEALVLDKHGLVTFADDARESYERTVRLVTLAEGRLARGNRAVVSVRLPAASAALADVAPIVRGACSLRDPAVEGAVRRQILAFRTSARIQAFVNGAELRRYAGAGVVTPDHAIRTKGWPLLLDAPVAGDLAGFAAQARTAVATFIDRYCDYFKRQDTRVGGGNRMLDPLPRVVLVPGLGLFGLGPTAHDAAIAADIAEAAASAILDSEAIGEFRSVSENDLFDIEYWSLEQAKLGRRTEPPLAGQVAAITGAAGAIGAATARAFAQAGAEVALLDLDAAAAVKAADTIGPDALALGCDVTDSGSVRAAFRKVAEHFGGLDILVSNAGAAWQGRIGEVDEAVLRKSFELNFFGHQRVAQAAVAIMRAQDCGGCLLFNVSKQAVNPGPNFGPYGLPKAATLLLVRQYALDYGSEGIRANAVNADRIRSGLLTADMIRARSSARGLSEKDYMSGNLLGREVTADDVAQAFLHQALQLKTTADVTTVDGGNIAAALR